MTRTKSWRDQAKRATTPDTVEYDGPAGGWGSLEGIAPIFGKEWNSPSAMNMSRRQNKPKGLMCVSCSWAKPADCNAFEFCDNSAKATLWELTSRRCEPDFVAEHTLTELLAWKDYDLEQQGRLTHHGGVRGNRWLTGRERQYVALDLHEAALMLTRAPWPARILRPH